MPVQQRVASRPFASFVDKRWGNLSTTDQLAAIASYCLYTVLRWPIENISITRTSSCITQRMR